MNDIGDVTSFEADTEGRAGLHLEFRDGLAGVVFEKCFQGLVEVHVGTSIGARYGVHNLAVGLPRVGEVGGAFQEIEASLFQVEGIHHGVDGGMAGERGVFQMRAGPDGAAGVVQDLGGGGAEEGLGRRAAGLRTRQSAPPWPGHAGPQRGCVRRNLQGRGCFGISWESPSLPFWEHVGCQSARGCVAERCGRVASSGAAADREVAPFPPGWRGPLRTSIGAPG